MRRPVKILLILLGAIVLTAMVVAVNIARGRSHVSGIEVGIRYGDVPALVAETTVKDSVLAAIPDLLQQQVREVDRDAVTAAAAHVPYLTGITTATSVSGKVVVSAKQRRPIARLFYGKRELYMDTEGALFPISDMGDCSVLVVSGDFTEPLRIDSLNAQTTALWQVAQFLDSKPKYSTLIDQLHILSNGDIIMVPKLGAQTIELGTPYNLDSKFAHLWAFYSKGMPRAGWDTYSKISLKFKGQVVCTKDKKQ